MLEQITLDKIKQLRLLGMYDALENIKKNQALQTLTFSEGLGLLVDEECHYRQTHRLNRLIKQAKLRYPQAMLEDINYEHKRAISLENFKWLASGHCQWSMVIKPSKCFTHWANRYR